MAEVKGVAVNKMEETLGVGLKDKIEGCIKDKDRSADLPQDWQDYLPFSPPAADQIASPRENSPKDSPLGNCSAANAHTWVSPNKSDEVPSSKESSPDAQSEQTALRENEKSSGELNADLEAEYEADFEPVAMEEQPDLDISVVGQRLEKGLSVADEVVLDASSKDFVKIIHGGKEVMLVLPSEVSCELGSTLELSETLAASLDITDEIVGLKTTAMLLDDESLTFKEHGHVVIPFSSLASGQLRRLIKNAEGMEGIPSFNLVTSNFDSYLENYQVEVASVESDEEDSQGEDSSSVSVREGALYTEAFVELMEKSEEFDPFEKNSLLRFGIDNAEQGNVLYRAPFRVAVYTGDMKYFVQGLKAIAKILLDVKASPTIGDGGDGSVSDTKQTSMSIFGVTDFVISADELFDSTDLTAQQYVTLLNAVLSGHSSVQSLFDLYHNPDFILACDSDEDLRGCLCLRDLLHLGKKLEPLQPQLQSQDDDLLKWAVKTGLHNFAAGMSTEMPQEFINIIYHMFSSGDEMVLAGCQKFLGERPSSALSISRVIFNFFNFKLSADLEFDTNDSDKVEEMLLREWDIFCRNKAFREEISDDASVPYAVPAEPPSTVISLQADVVTDDKASVGYSDGDFPDVLLTAVACLVDQQELSEDAAAAILASWSDGGNQLLRDIYDHFIEFGGVDDFLDMLKVVADEDYTSRMVATAAVNVNKSAEDAFRNVLKNMRAFGQVEIAALRLASVRK
eukprot:CAMPEP_0201925474 /NCGR_PEP_ID=MMETSP0903-20130614/14724_1 /ASSEMBLY_ACC=CAM_ASM_000552 /TAXON_ID=420261 /ORGANISM="Thalassiosira antarctica, Strain CCMP982" /LENGTH=738 /DNA_ID=CAMNT_0048463161 /DNA_START=55 /DNA_END=2269 /DNA_ORIENTATION=-